MSDEIMTPETMSARRLARQRDAYLAAGFAPADAQEMILAEISRPAPAVAPPAHDFSKPMPGPASPAGGRRLEDLLSEAAPVISSLATLLRQDPASRRGPRP